MREEKTIHVLSESEFKRICHDASMKQINDVPDDSPLVKILITAVLAEAMADVHKKLFS